MKKKKGHILKNDKGQVGIGTLIIFIAMILVAAVAAGVLLRTSGVLQTKATATGEQATKEVSTKVIVTQTVGYTSDAGSNRNLTAVILTVKLASGSSPIRMDDLILSYHSEDTYTSGILYQGSGNRSFNASFIKIVTNDSVLEHGEMVEITYTDSDSDLNLEPGKTFTITLQPKSGQMETVMKTVPDTIRNSYVTDWS
ncbi:flagellin [archaeon BMS3Bbin16]|nr:flagellin [archaeon BMS3Bbin16]